MEPVSTILPECQECAGRDSELASGKTVEKSGGGRGRRLEAREPEESKVGNGGVQHRVCRRVRWLGGKGPQIP